jgi:flagellar biosynthesis/type III secretory pathway M-ring protein FliF/YscJ
VKAADTPVPGGLPTRLAAQRIPLISAAVAIVTLVIALWLYANAPTKSPQ